MRVLVSRAHRLASDHRQCSRYLCLVLITSCAWFQVALALIAALAAAQQNVVVQERTWTGATYLPGSPRGSVIGERALLDPIFEFLGEPRHVGIAEAPDSKVSLHLIGSGSQSQSLASKPFGSAASSTSPFGRSSLSFGAGTRDTNELGRSTTFFPGTTVVSLAPRLEYASSGLPRQGTRGSYSRGGGRLSGGTHGGFANPTIQRAPSRIQSQVGRRI